MVVWQPSTDTMWEFWRARQVGRLARALGRPHDGRLEEPGYFTDPNPRWGATATSLPLLGGLMRLDELEAGRIDHALAFALPESRADAFSWPAQRTDGNSNHLNAIPEGARFRLDPSSTSTRSTAADRAHDGPGRPALRHGRPRRRRRGRLLRRGPDAHGPQPVPRPGRAVRRALHLDQLRRSSRGSTSRP